jgi:flagellar motor switch protein FliG
MKKKDILKEVYSEKQRKWACWQANLSTKKRKKGLSKKEAKEMCADVDHSLKQEEIINPKMKKSDLLEYIKHSSIKKKSKIVKEQDRDQYDFPYLREMTGQDRRDIMKYLETIRQSGIINMFGAAPILNWTRDDLHRFLYGESNDPESIERQIEQEEDQYDDEGIGSDIQRLEKELQLMNYLLDNKQKIRDILIRASLKRIDDTDGNHETSNVQRVFEKMAKESWSFWVGIQQV